MSNESQGQIKRYWTVKFKALSVQEKEFVHRFMEYRPVARDTNKEFEDKLSFGQRVADRVAAFGGSWTFILLCADSGQVS